MITSTSNPLVKEIRSYRLRKNREESGLCYVEGLRLVAEALQINAGVEKLLVAPELLSSDFAEKLVEQACTKGVAVIELSTAVFENLALKDSPAGLAAIVRQKWASLDDTITEKDGTWVVLDSVADPGNLGTILRTHEAVGGRGIILLDQSTDPYDPTAIRSSMGAIFNQRLVKATFDEFCEWKKKSGIPLIGSSDAASCDYQAIHYPARLALLMGSERQGLQPKHLEICDEVVAIPMTGRSDSLNLAVATGIILYEIFNQHRRLTIDGRQA